MYSYGAFCEESAGPTTNRDLTVDVASREGRVTTVATSPASKGGISSAYNMESLPTTSSALELGMPGISTYYVFVIYYLIMN